jgi:hypothetical protein
MRREMMGKQRQGEKRGHNLQRVEPFVGAAVPTGHLLAVVQQHAQQVAVNRDKHGLQQVDEHERETGPQHVPLQAPVKPPRAAQRVAAQGNRQQQAEGDDVGEDGNGR